MNSSLAENLASLNIEKWLPKCISDVQSKMILWNTTTEHQAVGTPAITFAIATAGMATAHIPGNDVEPSQLNNRKETIVLKDWNAAAYPDVRQLSQLPFDYQSVIANSCLPDMVAKRRDQSIIEALNDANVPQNGRVLVVGTAVEAAILTSDQFRRYDASGDSNALRAATIGSVGGMNVVVSNSIAEGEAFAFHRSAFQSVFRVPANPLGGVETGSGSYAGIAMRWVKDYDPAYMVNRSTFDTYFGINVVEDPVDYTDQSAGTELRRAVKLTLDLEDTEDPSNP